MSSICSAANTSNNFITLSRSQLLVSSSISAIKLASSNINKRIEVQYDRDYMIGHAYFINAKTDNEVIAIFQTKIIPLLQEYFYDD
nr:hypothetical protein [Bacillus sp. BH2]